ncbi:hypothetical protein DID88_007509 [Monilinia fructigena]|uniref:Phospholipase/carboxylesterase/thioesterase domain-containing protein n=1 Tax=Monilinia fructigena TaxID=38457 RepID=A0A395J3A1_9HELO|nr:hypothetical protein DID88_007509 [Monilinia fructigena]
MARQHPYAPWRRLILVPCWIIQILFPGFTLGIAAVGISLIIRNDFDDNDYESYDGSLRANLAIGWIYIIFSALCIILTITEIVSILRRKLRPLIFLITNVFKSTCWTALFILSFWDRFRVSQKTLPNILSLVVNIILLLAFYIPLAHGAIIFHHNRKVSQYEPVDPKHASYNSSEPFPEAFPHAYKSFTTIEQTTDLEANDRTTGRPRRLSYNHKRDTRFDSYKQTRRSFSDSNVVGSVAANPTEAPFSVRSRSKLRVSKKTSNPATFIFLHGYGDDADGWINIAQQFQAAGKLPHLTWVFPNAPFNHESMSTAWYTPSSFSPIPVGRSRSKSTTSRGNKDLEVDIYSDSDTEETLEPEIEKEVLRSVEYVNGLIDEEIGRGVKIERIVVGGFSQGCAVSLLTALGGRYRGRIGGWVGLSGYLPRGSNESGGIGEGLIKGRAEIAEGKKNGGEKNGMMGFLVHGSRDMLVPMRVFRDTRKRVERIMGVGEEQEGNNDENLSLRVKIYEGLGHRTCGSEFKDLSYRVINLGSLDLQRVNYSRPQVQELQTSKLHSGVDVRYGEHTPSLTHPARRAQQLEQGQQPTNSQSSEEYPVERIIPDDNRYVPQRPTRAELALIRKHRSTPGPGRLFGLNGTRPLSTAPTKDERRLPIRPPQPPPKDSEPQILKEYSGTETMGSKKEIKAKLANRSDRLGYWRTPSPAQGVFHSIGETGAPIRRYTLEFGKVERKVSNGSGAPDLEENRSCLDDKATRSRYIPWFLRDKFVVLWCVISFVLLLALIIVSFLPATAIRNGFPPLVIPDPKWRWIFSRKFPIQFHPILDWNDSYLLFQPIDMAFRKLQPWAELANPEGAPAEKSLLPEYTAALPIQCASAAVGNGNFRVAWFSLASFLFLILPVLAGGIFFPADHRFGRSPHASQSPLFLHLSRLPHHLFSDSPPRGPKEENNAFTTCR